MTNTDFFPLRSEAKPMIYAYEDSNPEYYGLLKIGYTTVSVDERVAQQYPTKRPDGKVPYRILWQNSAMYSDGGTFTDRDIHRALIKRGIKNVGGEWFRCTIHELEATYIAVRDKTLNLENRTQSFKMRPEQEEAVSKTIEYYRASEKDERSHSAKFLWNAKMRFGKTFASYQLAKRMGLKKILVITFKPAVQSAWEEDLNSHVDFEGWQFISNTSKLAYQIADLTRPIVCFGSFQDFLGTNENGGIKAKNEWIHTTNWDLVIFDEYHFGAWRDNAKKLFEFEDEDAYDLFDSEVYAKKEAGNAINESFLPITTSRYLFLSGTPFRALNSGEFIEDQIYNWTYTDEQRAKENWKEPTDNPYAALPRMVMMTYKIPDSISDIAKQGEYDEFDLNVFFSAEGKGRHAKFKFEDYVQKWLDLIRGAHLPTTVDELKLGADRPRLPYKDANLLQILTHTLWFLPNVASCFAMANLLRNRNNSFYHDYKINVVAGSSAGIGVSALPPVLESMGDPLMTKTITLTCGKLTTGVTVKPWTGIFMLRNLSSPETYFQSAFRVQSPWVIDIDGGKKEIMKHECYVFDFALNRALRQISEYSCRLDVNESNPERKVAEFINFLPVLAYDGSSMRQLNETDILDVSVSGTSATLLARRWESALLVNVDNDTLTRLMANEEAMRALMSIEGFRSLSTDISDIIIASENVKKAKAKGDRLTPKEEKEISEKEKEFKSKRDDIRKKLIKFATRIPVFMYLTDFREYSLHDVITQLEPGLFKRVTGLNVKDFELLVSLGVFNGGLMNDAVYKFKRYEDSSLNYTGIDRHLGQAIGGYDTVLTRDEFERLYGSQQLSLGEVNQSFDDLSDLPYEMYFSNEEDNDSTEPDFTRTNITDEGGNQSSCLPQTRKESRSSSKIDKNDSIINALDARAEYSLPESREISKVAEDVTRYVPTDMNERLEKPISKHEKLKISITDLGLGMVVQHQAFGSGIITHIENEKKRIRVTFEGGEKLFQVPLAFDNGFLEL